MEQYLYTVKFTHQITVVKQYFCANIVLRLKIHCKENWTKTRFLNKKWNHNYFNASKSHCIADIWYIRQFHIFQNFGGAVSHYVNFDRMINKITWRCFGSCLNAHTNKSAALNNTYKPDDFVSVHCRRRFFFANNYLKTQYYNNELRLIP